MPDPESIAAAAARLVCLCWANAAACLKTSLAGERVVEHFSGSSSGHVGGRVSESNAAHGICAQDIGSDQLTCLDFSNNMLVTSEPMGLSHRGPGSQYHNNINIASRNSAGQKFPGRGAKYVVDKSLGHVTGEDNFDYDPFGCFSHDNLGFESQEQDDMYGPYFDPGYGSERSAEEEDMPTLCHGLMKAKKDNREAQRTFLEHREGVPVNLEYLMKVCPFIVKENLFEVILMKSSRGLGLAVTGGIECETEYPGLIRIKTLYPQTPAWLCGQLEKNDIILEVNGKPLTGLTSHEALEVLRTSSREAKLLVCRPPSGYLKQGADVVQDSQESVVTTSLMVPQPDAFNYLIPSPSFTNYGEFEVQLTKVAGSLGFTLRKQDNSILGHTIRSLVKEPAISDGRIRPGDKLLSVNGTDVCGMSHEEAVHFLRTCPDTVIIRLYRDAMQTPISPASPTEPEFLPKPKALRKEARDMLSDLASRKNSLGQGDSASLCPGTPRRRRLQKTPSPDLKAVVADRWDSLVRRAESDDTGSTPSAEEVCQRRGMLSREPSPFDNSLSDTTITSHMSSSRNGNSRTGVSGNDSDNSSCHTHSSAGSESRPKRPNFLDLGSRHSSSRKSQFTPPHEVDRSFSSPVTEDLVTSPAASLDSVPQLNSSHSDNAGFAHMQQGYLSVTYGAIPSQADQRLPCTSSVHNLSSHLSSGSPEKKNALLKWKGVIFTPEGENSLVDGHGRSSPSEEKLHKPKMVTVDLARGWNSRLGFSLKPQDNKTVVVAVYADSVAAKDGRLKIGDQVVKVNGEDVSEWQTDDIIDMLRKTRGKICLTVLQQPF